MLAKSISGAAAAASPAYIEDVFSTYLYTGNGSTQTITNGIDLSGKGGLVWIKGRSGVTSHRLTDTARGATKSLESNNTTAEVTESIGLTAFNGTGFTIGHDADYNTSSDTYVSWTFRKQPKFFDVVTYTGNGTTQNISHSLGSTPGCIIVKRTDTTAPWAVAHRGTSNYSSGTDGLNLNTTDAVYSGTVGGWWNSTGPTSTQFSVGNFSETNANGGTYVAYLFAHDAGGFGLTGTDNVISCGSFTTDGSGNATVNLGYEPQWILMKRTDTAGVSWILLDTMRGWTVSGDDAALFPNNSTNESFANRGNPTATGFEFSIGSQFNAAYIYIAIRRGPMKVPTSGTSVFTPITKTADAATATLSEIGFPFDMVFNSATSGSYGGSSSYSNFVSSRLTGLGTSSSPAVQTSATSLESSYSYTNWNGTTFSVGSGWGSTKWAWLFFRRAPGFFDVVCYTGNGVSGRTVPHNLAAVPELIIAKTRNNAIKWTVYSAAVGNTAALFLNLTDTPETGSYFWNNTNPTASNFTLGNSAVNNNGNTHIAYLFATCPGVSKVGSYTGTGTTKQIDCGFTGGARFVLIKRTDSTGDWYVWDTARGIVAGNDPYLLLNSTAAEVTSTDYIDTYSAGFEISSTAPADINANGGTYIFLAVA